MRPYSLSPFPFKPKLITSRDLSRSVVTIKIGPETDDQESFVVHKELIRQHSSFFHSALDSTWEEGKTGIVVLPQETPEVFKIYANWLYTQRLGLDKSQVQNFNLLVDLYDLGYRFGTRLFQNTCMDAIHQYCCAKPANTTASTPTPTPTTNNTTAAPLLTPLSPRTPLPQAPKIQYVYSKSEEDSLLRQFLIDIYILKADFASPEFYNLVPSYPEEFIQDLFQTLCKNKRIVKLETGEEKARSVLKKEQGEEAGRGCRLQEEGEGDGGDPLARTLPKCTYHIHDEDDEDGGGAGGDGGGCEEESGLEAKKKIFS